MIEQGDKLYKLQNTLGFLSCPDLPRSVNICNVLVRINFENNIFGFLNNNNNSKLELIRNLESTVTFTGIIFLINGFSFSIIRASQFYYIVDSHSRDTLGRPSAFGFGVILKFENIVELVNYIFAVYHYSGNTQYEVQFLVVPTRGIDDDVKRNVVTNHISDFQKHIF